MVSLADNETLNRSGAQDGQPKLANAKTLIACIAALPKGAGGDPAREAVRRDARGFRFVGLKPSDERFFSYKELEDEAMRRAGLLQDEGLTQGQRAVLVLASPEEFVLSFLGCVFAGVVPVPVSPRPAFKAKESYRDNLGHVLSASGAVALLTDQKTAEAVELEKLKDFKSIALTGFVETLFAESASANGVWSVPEVGPEDLCFLQFTSGSTSRPKGVQVTHANLLANARAFLGPEGLNRKDSDLGVSWLPLFHDMGLIGFVLGTLVCDIPVVLLPTDSFARMPRRWLELVSDYGGTITYAPNFAYDLVTKRTRDKDLQTLDLNQLRAAGCGAEPIRASTLEAFAERFAPCGFKRSAFVPSYGMAESTLAITLQREGESLHIDNVDSEALSAGRAVAVPEGSENATRIIGCGRPFALHEVQIRNDEGQVLAEREVGEVVTRGPSVTRGYFEQPEASAELLRDGFMFTGDLGYFADGVLYICGRKKDLIIVRGANYYPQDIEWTVGDLDGVRRGNVVAFGVQPERPEHDSSEQAQHHASEKADEELVIIAEAGSADAQRLRDEIPQVVATQHGLKPADVVVVALGTIPKTSSGKPQRRKARALYLEGQLERR